MASKIKHILPPNKRKYIYKIIFREACRKKNLQIFFFLGSYKLPILHYSLVHFKRKERTIGHAYKLWFMLRLRRKLYFKSVCIPQISLKPFLPLCSRINLSLTQKGSFTFHKKEETSWKQVFSTQQRSLYVWGFLLFSMTFLLKRENLLFGWGLGGIFFFLVHICYTFINLRNSYHGNSSIYI